MKTSFGKEYNFIFSQNNIKSNQFFQNVEQFKSSNNSANPTIYQSIFNQNKYKGNTNNISVNTNQKKFIKEKSNNDAIPLEKIINMPRSNYNMIPKAYLNPKRNSEPINMKLNKGIKNFMNQNASKSQERQDNFLKKSAVFQNNNSNNKYMEEIQRKKMGNSQMNFYTKNNMNYFPNIQNNNNIFREKENLYSINSNWMIYSQNSYSQQDVYNDFINNIIRNNPKQNLYKDNYMRIFDFEYKRKEEKLKKGQNQLILERLQKKYEAQIKQQNMQKTGIGFYNNNKNKRINKRQRSAQDNKNNINFNKKNDIDKKEAKTEITKKNSINSVNSFNSINAFDKDKIQIDANQSINNDKKFNKTYNTGFNFKKSKKERRKKEKLIFSKIFKYFKKRTKNNYLWVRYFNKKIKMRFEEEDDTLTINKTHKKQKSLDKSNIYPMLIKKLIKKNVIYKKTKKIKIKKENIKYNTDNSEIDEIKEYKKLQKKLKTRKSEYTHYININNNNKNKEQFEYESSYSSSDESFINKKQPQFRGIFDKENKNNTNANEAKEEKEPEKRNFNFRTTSNFFSKNNNFNEKNKNSEQKFESNKDQKNKFNIENIINNVIENNKKAAAARSSTSFYNIGSNFMNNRMRSTKTNFYSSKDNKGGGFTGTKDSNFTKDQANEGRYYKPNSLKLTLINPLGWRKHEEIWGNLVSLKLGLSDLEKYLHPPNDTDVLVSSYLKMNPRVLNFCSIQKINTSKTNNENNNFISFMIDDNIQNPKQEIKKWKEAYKRVIFRWHPDKLFHALEEINFKNEQQKIELKKRSTQIINNMNTLYRNIIEILNKIADSKNEKEENY